MIAIAGGDNPAVAGQDFVDLGGGLVVRDSAFTFAPNQTTKTFRVPFLDDTLVDGPKTMLVFINDCPGTPCSPRARTRATPTPAAGPASPSRAPRRWSSTTRQRRHDPVRLGRLQRAPGRGQRPGHHHADADRPPTGQRRHRAGPDRRSVRGDHAAPDGRGRRRLHVDRHRGGVQRRGHERGVHGARSSTTAAAPAGSRR